jgi:hypothetical protein
MDFGISSPEDEKGVVIGAMTPKGTLSGMIMGGCGEMFDLAEMQLFETMKHVGHHGFNPRYRGLRPLISAAYRQARFRLFTP